MTDRQRLPNRRYSETFNPECPGLHCVAKIPRSAWLAHVFTAAQLEDWTFDPISYVIPRLFPEGLTILAGRPKVGKSWMALDIALGVAGGRYILGDIKLEEGDVLYAALEDN